MGKKSLLALSLSLFISLCCLHTLQMYHNLSKHSSLDHPRVCIYDAHKGCELTLTQLLGGQLFDKA